MSELKPDIFICQCVFLFSSHTWTAMVHIQPVLLFLGDWNENCCIFLLQPITFKVNWCILLETSFRTHLLYRSFIYLWPVNSNKFCQFLSSPISLLRCRLWKQRAASWVSQSAYHVFSDVFCVRRLIVLNRHGKCVKCICLNTFWVRQRLSIVLFLLN